MVLQALRACRLATFILLLAVSAWAQPRPATGVSVAAPLVAPPVSGLSCATSTTRCVPSEYATIDACWEAMSAGDTCLVSAGTYAEVPASTRNGSSGNTLTFVASGTVNVCGWDFNGNSYIRVIGFVLDNVSGGCGSRTNIISWLGSNTKLEIWNNTLRHDNRGIGMAVKGDRCFGCIVIGNVGTNINVPVIDGGGGFLCCYFNDILAAYNDMGPIDADAFNFQGQRNMFWNNYLHEVSQGSGHTDFFQSDAHDLGTQYTWAEGNFQLGVGNLSDEHIGVIQNLTPSQCEVSCGAVTENLWRRNVFYNISAGLGVSYGTVATMTNTRYYGNTEVDTVRYSGTPNQLYSTNFFNGVDWVFLRNNIMYEAWGTAVSSNLTAFYSEAANNDIDYNLAFDVNSAATFGSFWSNQAHKQSDIDPNFVDKAGIDFHLSAGSGDGANARGTAGPLTTATSCSGTTLNVASRGGGFFRGDNTTLDQYGGNLVVGDTITVGSNTRVIASISGDVITLTSSLTCSNGDPVYFGDDTTPDMGALPYKPGGYSLTATYVNSGGTVTVTPSDVNLVRFVICYSDGVPYAVDNASPYTCTSPGGTLNVRVYPLYASQPVSGLLWRVATP